MCLFTDVLEIRVRQWYFRGWSCRCGGARRLSLTITRLKKFALFHWSKTDDVITTYLMWVQVPIEGTILGLLATYVASPIPHATLGVQRWGRKFSGDGSSRN